MGITIVQKSDLARPKSRSKIALVLSGGGISGGAFKLGGLQALNRFMLNWKTADADMFVGVSAGALISTYLANGIPLEEIVGSMEGRPGMLDPIRASELFSLNYTDIITIPPHILEHILTLALKGILDFLAANNIFRRRFRNLLMKMIISPSYENVRLFVNYCMKRRVDVRNPSLPWHFIPNGIFRTDRFEQANRENLENNHLSNGFTSLYEKTGKELYIVATKLNTAGRTVFGHDYISDVPISKAMQASIAIPLFYKPVDIDGEDYVDGAVVKTTSMDIAIEKKADLIICYNPFRPFNCESFSMRCTEDEAKRSRIADDGIYAVLNQVMRSMLHTRLMHGMELYQKNPEFQGDIILIEPTEYDDAFFDMNPMAFWERRRAAKRGFESVRNSIITHYPLLKKILKAHGIETDPEFIKDVPTLSVPDHPNACLCE